METSKRINMKNFRELEKDLTPEGLSAVIVATDPFHDSAINNFRGYPDRENRPSVSRCLEYTMEVSASADGDVFVIDVHPYLGNYYAVKAASRAGNYLSNVSGTYTLSNLQAMNFVTVDKYASSTNMRQSASLGHFTMGPSSLDVGIETRICGAGIEVHNVTPELYEGGTITICETPQPFIGDPQNVTCGGTWPEWDGSAFVNRTCVSHSVTTHEVIPRPTDLSSAMYLPGTVQWEAKKGAYVPIRVSSSSGLLPSRRSYINYDYWGPNARDIPGSVSSFDNSAMWITDVLAINSLGTYGCAPAPVCHAPISTKTIVLSALPAQSKFQINVKIYLEQFPDLSDQKLVSLARPSPKEDLLATKLINDLMINLPIAVPVGANPLGEWWRYVVKEALALAVDYGDLIHPAVPILARSGQRVMKKQKKNTGRVNGTMTRANTWGDPLKKDIKLQAPVAKK